MMDERTRSSNELQQAVDGFWETYPPLWRGIQAHIRTVAAEQFDISVEQFHILRHIRHGVDSVSALAETRGISRSVDLLVTRGLVARAVDPQDRRHVRLALTAEGDALMDAVFGDTRRWMMQKFALLSPAEVRGLTASLESLKKVI
jgi:DNA-binding MarR family transcriptional regulator